MWAVAVTAAVAAAFAHGRPTGLAAVDVLWRMGVAATVTVSVARARRWTWCLVAGVAATLGAGWPQALALVALVVAVVAVFGDGRRRVAGAIVGFGSAQALLRLPTFWPARTSAVVAAAALLPVAVSAYRVLPRRAQRRLRYGVLGAGGVLFILCWAFVLATIGTRTRVEVGVTRTRQAVAAARAGDSTAAAQQFRLAAAAFQSAHDSISSWYLTPVRVLPLVGPHATAISVATGQGASLARVAAGTIRVADIQRLRFANGMVDLSQVRAMAPVLGRGATSLGRADRAIAGIPRTWLVPALGQRLDELAKQVGTASNDANIAATAVDRLPGLLGADGPRHYLVLFTTPAESRSAGGFLGDFAEIAAAQGKVTLQRTGQVADLNDLLGPDKKLTGPPGFLQYYGPQRPGRYFQNVTASPNFPDVGNVVTQLYPQAAGGEPIDGVVLMDPYALAAILQITGPVAVPGLAEPLNGRNAADLLLRRQYFLFDQGPTNSLDQHLRYDFLGRAGQAAFEALVSRATLPPARQLVDLLGPLVQQRRLLAYSLHPDEEQLFGRAGLDGSFPHARGDLVAMFEDNAGPNKLDAYLRRELDYHVTYDDRMGSTTAVATIRLTNDVPAGALPQEVGYNRHGEAFATNETQVRFDSPLALQSATVNGADAPVGVGSEFGMHTYTSAVSIPRGQTFTIVLRLQGATRRGGYDLTLVHQPLVNDDHVHVTVQGARARGPVPATAWLANGDTSQMSFDLNRDKVLHLRFGRR